MPGGRRCRGGALVGAAPMIEAVNRIGRAHAPHACATVGFAQVSSNSRNTIPAGCSSPSISAIPRSRC
jgi:beta-ureidopropionase / N-carbamoyl-L-amino-acid hydrolase